MITVELDNYNKGFGDFEIEQGDDHSVSLTIREEQASEPRLWRTLTPSEARAFAAALRHYASECER